MVNGIDSISTKNLTNVHLQPAFKAANNEPKTVTVPEFKAKSDGMVELSNYNRAMVNKIPNLDVEPLLPVVMAPDKIEAIEGERIYDSKGQLHSIVDNKDDLKTIYKIVDGNVYLVTKVDNTTGKTVYKQLMSDDGWTITREYDGKTGEMTRSSYYDEKGNLESTDKFYNKPNGTSMVISKNKGGYYIDEHSDTMWSSVRFDENKKINSMTQEILLGNKKVRNERNYYEGSLISSTREETSVVPNAFSREILNDPELKPSRRFDSDFDFKGHQGEKTYYSNGALESNIITTEDGVAKAEFTPDGRMSKVAYGRHMYEFKENGGQIIHVYLGNNTEKITEYYGGIDRHEVDVTLKTPDGEKRLICDSKGQPVNYWDDVNGKYHSFVNGMLCS